MIKFPEYPGATSVTFTPLNAVAVVDSEFTFHRKVHEWDGKVWSVQIEMGAMEEKYSRIWKAWIVSLKGPVNTFEFGPYSDKKIRGNASGVPLVNGTSHNPGQLNIDNCAHDTQNFFMAGDWISVASRLYQVTSDVDSNISGAAVLNIWPDLHPSTSDNSEIEYLNPVGTWRLNSSIALPTIDIVGNSLPFTISATHIV